MPPDTIGARIDRARDTAGLSQRALAQATGISQSTLSRIIAGDREPKTPEVLTVAWATGTTLSELTGNATVADRAQCVARATNDTDMGQMRDALLHFLALDAYLDDQAIQAPA